jgi:hypothetical protein
MESHLGYGLVPAEAASDLRPRAGMSADTPPKTTSSRPKGQQHSANRWFVGDLQHHEDGSRPLSEHVAIVHKAGYDLICLQYKDMEDPSRVPDPDELTSESFLVIPGSEQAFLGSRGLWMHMGFMPFGIPIPDTITDYMNIAQGLAEVERRSPDCLKVIHHPGDERWLLEDVRAAYEGGARFFELNLERSGKQFPIDLWDQALSAGMFFYATMSTDAHSLAGIRIRGYVRVRAARLRRDDILGALKAGDFVAVEEGCEAVVTDVARPGGKAGGQYRILGKDLAEVRFIGRGGNCLATVHANEATYVIIGSEGYVRAEVLDSAGVRCFTQPVMLSA